MSPTPLIIHQEVSSKIDTQLNIKLEKCRNFRVLLPVDWIIDEENVLQPDNMVICYEPEGKFLTKSPSIIFEILSPAVEKKDRETKFYIYESQGVKYYIIVDSQKQTAEIFQLTNSKYIKVLTTKDDSFQFEIEDCKFSFEFSKIWSKSK